MVESWLLTVHWYVVDILSERLVSRVKQCEIRCVSVVDHLDVFHMNLTFEDHRHTIYGASDHVPIILDLEGDL